MQLARSELILGGQKSGKSRRAEELARLWLQTPGQRATLIATAQAHDAEMAERIVRHRAERGEGWTTVEAPLDLAGAVAGLGAGDVAVVDCLTLWLTNRMLADADLEAEYESLAVGLNTAAGPVVLVSNEVGLSIVPENALARRFRDEAGRLNQKVAALADEAWFVAAGLPLRLK